MHGSNIKLTSVANSIDTQSDFKMFESLPKGIVDPAILTFMVKGRMKSKSEELKRALTELIRPPQQLMLKSMLTHIAELDSPINTLNYDISRRLSEEVDFVEALDEITGAGEVSAH